MIIQNAPDSLARWFYTNAPAGWIVAVVATAGFLWTLRSRKKPKRIIVRETKNTTLVTIWPSVRKNIELLFAGRKINTLAQLDLDIFNQGSEVIQRPRLTVTLPAGCNVLAALLVPDSDGVNHKIEGNKIALQLPYVNPFSEHKHIWKLSILADGDTAKVTVNGGGEGWSVQLSQLPTVAQRAKRNKTILLCGLGSLIFLFFYERFITIHFGVGPYEFSWRALILGFPGVIPVLFWLGLSFWLDRPTRNR